MVDSLYRGVAPSHLATQADPSETAYLICDEKKDTPEGTDVKKHIPDFKISYKPDYRQAIANSWPQSIDDSVARKDWGWKEEYDLSAMTSDMFANLGE